MVDDLSLWYFAVKHYVWVYNWLPNQISVITPMEMLTKTKSNYWYLRRSRDWVFPVYFLEAKLQNNQKLPKWNWRSCLGQFLGFSEEHSTLVANVCHLRTGYILPQYRLVFDDLFKIAVRLGYNEPAIDNICNYFFDSSRDWYSEE